MPHRRNRRRNAFAACAATLSLEALEPRMLLSALTPAMARAAYGFDQLVYANGTIAASGYGQTIAIVAAFDDPTIVNDLNVFDATMPIVPGTTLAAYGDASTVLTKHEMSASETTDAGWSQEISLDVEWAHAIAPGAHILLVEAASDSLTDLLAAVDYASAQPGVSVVSMSWGSTEFSAELNDDPSFTTPAGHQGVTFVAAAGDSSGTTWPSVSPYVLAVGGTTLATAPNGTYLGEAAWSDTGGGTSSLENAPTFETALTGSTMRVAPDVSYDADPQTGFIIYDSTPYEGSVGWQIFGGTSAGTPQWSALVAIANQGRALLGESSLDGPTQTLPAIDSLPASDFHDVTLGGSGYDSAGPGYDDLTGRGSPVANRLIVGLLTWTATDTTVSRTATTVAPTPAPSHRHRYLTQLSVVSPMILMSPELRPAATPAARPIPAYTLLVAPVTTRLQLL